MALIHLNKHYWCYTDNITQIVNITAEFKSQGLFIRASDGKSIMINKKGQKILYEELKKRFE